jgi:hypothetical protein
MTPCIASPEHITSLFVPCTVLKIIRDARAVEVRFGSVRDDHDASQLEGACHGNRPAS